MEIKKHRININIINDKARADTGSNFVLDLKNQSDKLGGLSDNEADIIAKLAAENEPPVTSIKNDWLKIIFENFDFKFKVINNESIVIIKNIAELLKGKIEMDIQEETGSMFILQIPSCLSQKV